MGGVSLNNVGDVGKAGAGMLTMGASELIPGMSNFNGVKNGGVASTVAGLNPYKIGDKVKGAPGVDQSGIPQVDTTGQIAGQYANTLLGGPRTFAGNTPQMTGAQIAGLDGGNGITGNAGRIGALGSMNYLQGIANGTQANPAAIAAQQQQGAAMAQQAAMANSNRGFYNASNARQAMSAGANASAQIGSNAVGQIAQTQMGAAQAAGALGGQIYGQDSGLATQQAGLTQGAAQANLGANLQVGLGNLGAATTHDQQILGAGGLYNQGVGQNMSGGIDIQRLIQSGALGNAGIDIQKLGMGNSMVGGLLGGAGQMGAAGIQAGGMTDAAAIAAA